jgi:hypothetical protein
MTKTPNLDGAQTTALIAQAEKTAREYRHLLSIGNEAAAAITLRAFNRNIERHGFDPTDTAK